jgi:hypothetical protein
MHAERVEPFGNAELSMTENEMPRPWLPSRSVVS